MHLLRILFLFLLILLLSSCSDGSYHKRLLMAEEQVTQNVDSCASLLTTIPSEDLNREDQALHGLVSSWLLYRQYAKEIPEEPLERAFDYFHESKDPHRRAQAFFLRAVIHQDQKRGEPSQWMEDLYAACLAIEQTDDHLLASQIYQNYAAKLSELYRFEEARPWIDKFVDAAQRSGHRGEYVQSLILQSANRLYLEEERVKREFNVEDGKEVALLTHFDEAFAIIYPALDIALQNRMEVELGRIYNHLSICHSRCQQADSVLHYARLSVQINERLYAEGRRKQLPQYATLADAFRKAGNADSAIYYARKTYETPGMPLRNKRAAAQMLYNVYSELLGDYQSSLEWMRIYNHLSDSINQRTIVSNIEAVQNAAVREQEKTVLREEKRHTEDWFIWSMVAGILIIIGISVRMANNRRRYHAQLQGQEDDFNQKIAEMQTRASSVAETPHSRPEAASSSTSEASVDTPKQTTPGTRIILTGSTREQIEIETASLLFLTSESNYVKVLHLDANGKVQSKMIRQTMNNVESQLNAFPHIIRCHRAFIVNLQHVCHASTSTSGLLLTLDATTLQVPVSKTYISLVKASLE